MTNLRVRGAFASYFTANVDRVEWIILGRQIVRQRCKECKINPIRVENHKAIQPQRSSKCFALVQELFTIPKSQLTCISLRIGFDVIETVIGEWIECGERSGVVLALQKASTLIT